MDRSDLAKKNERLRICIKNKVGIKNASNY